MKRALRFGLIAIIVLLPFITLLSYLLVINVATPRLIIASGSNGGLYYKLGQNLAQLLNANLGRKLSFVNQESRGSTENVESIQQGAVQLAFAQDGLDAGANVRALARLYDSPLHIVVPRSPALDDVGALRSGTRIFMGAKGSGTRTLMTRVLQQYGMKPEQFEIVGDDWSFDQAATELTAHHIGAAAFLVGFNAPALQKIADDGGFTLLPIRRAAGLITALPYVSRNTIPAASYAARVAFPTEATETIATHELLIASAKLEERYAYEIVQTLFTSSSKAVTDFPLLTQLSRIEPDRNFYYPLHEGASSFYRRSGAPSLISPAQLGAAGSYSLSTLGGLLVFVRRRRVRRATKKVNDLRDALPSVVAPAEAARARAALDEAHKQALADLVAGRLALEGFRTIQECLLFCEAELERRRVAEPDQRPASFAAPRAEASSSA